MEDTPAARFMARNLLEFRDRQKFRRDKWRVGQSLGGVFLVTRTGKDRQPGIFPEAEVSQSELTEKKH
jgi:hypothetical protein